MKQLFNTIIVGAGPSGMSASIYLKRFDIDVALVEAGAPGGQIAKTAQIENYPGTTEIKGIELAMNMFKQTQHLEIPYIAGVVNKINKTDDGFELLVDDNNLKCKNVIVATGRRPRKLKVKNEEKYAGRGISWCAICDGPFFKGKDVVVIGGGNSALEESLYLAEFTNKVTIIQRENKLTGDKSLQKEVYANPKIEVILNDEVLEFKEENDKLSGVKLKSNNEINCDGAFIYIGFVPVTEMVEHLGVLNPYKYIEVDKRQKTKVEGLYAAGDVTSKHVYQIVTATSDGAKAAIAVKEDMS